MSRTESVNRRALLSSGLALPLALVLPPIGRVYAQSPVMMMQAANTALGLMSQFMGSGSEVVAMLAAQQTYLSEIVARLDSIQLSLLALNRAIALLPDTIRQQLANQFRQELVANISGAATRYSILLKASISDTTIFGDATTINKVRDIENVAAQAKATLSQLAEGIGPEAAMIAPLSLSLEIACLSRQKAKRSEIIANLDAYDGWLARMVGNEPKSIPDYQATAIAAHDATVAQAANSRDGQLAGVANFALAGSQIGSAMPDPCILLSATPDQLTSELPDSRTRNADQAFKYGSAYAYQEMSRVTAEEDATFGIMLLKYPSDRHVVISAARPELLVADGRMTGPDTGPPHGTLCFLQQLYRWPWTQMNSEKIIAEVNSPGGRLTRNRAEFPNAELVAAVAAINLERAKIGFAVKAANLVNQTRLTIGRFRQVIA